MAKEGDSILRLEIDIRSKTVIRSSVRGDTTMPFKSFFLRYMSSDPYTSLDEIFTYEVIDSYISARENQVAVFPYDDRNGALVFTFIWMKDKPDMLFINVTELNAKVLGTSLHSTDSLTGLYARSHTVSLINSHIKKHSPFNKCGFVLIDINDFKHINDTFGHKVGDECLKAFAAKLREVTSKGLMGRYGGDEFLIFVDDTNEQDLVEIAKSVLATNISVKVGHKNVSITCCCGISIMNYSAAEFSILLQQADKSLKLAKGNNKKEAYMDSKLVAKINQSKVVSAEHERKKSKKPVLFKDEIRRMKAKYGVLGTFLGLLCMAAVVMLVYIIFFAFKEQVHQMAEARPLLHGIVHSQVLLTSLFAFLSIYFSIRLTNSKIRAVKNKYIDPWTGGINAERFLIDAPRIVKNSKDYAVVQFNIIGYKSILEYIGKEKSDLLIIGAYNTIMGCLDQKTEFVARNYGDRFIAVLKGDNYDEIKERLEAIKTHIEAYVSLTYFMTTNVVIGVYYPEKEITDFDTAISRSDLALSHVDREFLMQTIIQYKDEMLLKEVSETDFFNKAKRAMYDGNFSVVYQGKKDLISNKWVGSEALLRWKDPANGEFNDSQIIPLLEKNGLIIDLDVFVFKTLVEELSEAKSMGIKLLPASFNVSARHMVKSDWLDDYKKIIKEYNFDPSMLEFEFTEDAFRASEKSVADAIEQIHKMGAKVALDDFGKGYSSLSIIRTLNFDTIKLDGAYFIGQNGLDEKTRKLIRHLVDICRDLGKSVVFEKVDSKQAADVLKMCGITTIQGFLYSKPQPKEECIRILKQNNQ